METAEKISITVSPEILRLIRQSVDAGEYASTSEVIGDAMRLWQRQREQHAETVQSIKARIRRSLDDPRPSLSEAEADAALEGIFGKIDEEFGHAPSQG
jgi:antitoxin ParD1/3/4